MAFQNIGGLLVRGQPFGAIKTPEEKVKTNRDGTIHTVRYVALWSNYSSLLPGYYSADPTYPGLVLKDIEADKWMGKLAKVTLTYGPMEYEPSPDGVPPTEISESSLAGDIDIQLHPDFNDNSKFPDEDKVYDVKVDENGNEVKTFVGFKKGSDFAGYENYGAGSKVVTVTSYYRERPASDQIYVIVPVSGYSDAWLRVSSDVNPSGQWFVKRNVYQLSVKGWNTTIYRTE